MVKKIGLDFGFFNPVLLARCFFINIPQILNFVANFCNIQKG